MKERLDVLVVSRGLAPSREKAKAIIMAGNVLVDGQREDKAGSMFKDTVEITVKGHTLPYVSRGGLKLEKAMTHFGVTLKDKVCTTKIGRHATPQGRSDADPAFSPCSWWKTARK